LDCKGFSALAAVEVAAACRFWGLACDVCDVMMMIRSSGAGEFRECESKTRLVWLITSQRAFGIISIDTKGFSHRAQRPGMPVLQECAQKACLAFWARPRRRDAEFGFRSAPSCEASLPRHGHHSACPSQYGYQSILLISFPPQTPNKPFHTQHSTSTSKTTTRSSSLC